MAKFLKIESKDALNTGRKKLNSAIDGTEESLSRSNQALNASSSAVNIANQANQKSDATQKQVDDLILGDGTDIAEVVQARGGEDLLYKRLDKTDNQLYGISNVQNWELNSKAREKKGITVFTSDDGRIEEYTIAKPLFESEGVPQTIGIVSNWIGSTNFCTKEQLLELQNDLGWEIASHSRTHPSNPPMIDNPDNEFVEREFWESKQILTNMGFSVSNYIYPGGNYSKRERLFAKKHYRAARQSDAGYFGGINYSPLNSHELKTVWLDPSSYLLKSYLEQYTKPEAILRIIAHIKTLIDEARSNNGLLIISTHFMYINDIEYQNMYREIIRYAKSNTEVTTLNDALNKMGNIVEIGDYSEQGNRAVGSNHYVVGVDGTVSGSLSVVEEDSYSADTPFVYFPLGVTVCPIRNKTNGLPTNGPGTLINFKPYPHEPGSNKVNYGWQEFISYDNQLPKFRRDATGNSTYNRWYSDSLLNMARYNNFDLNTPYSDFPIGITVSRILADNPSLNQAPEGRQGTLYTVKQDTFTNLSRYSYQEFQLWGSDRVYRRRVVGANEFGRWFIISGVVLADQNNFDTTTPPSEFFPGLTYSIVSGDNPNVSQAPESTRGSLKTDKPLATDLPVYITQEYTPYGSNNVYKRSALDAGRWGRWKRIPMEIV